MFVLDNIDSIRKKVTDLVARQTPETLHRIPTGFNNNIIWNFGHLVISGYSLVFRVTGVDPDFEIPYLNKYRKGSHPEGTVDAGEIEALIRLSDNFTTAVKALLGDADRVKEITGYTTDTFGVPITTIQDMLVTVAMHDTSHWQVIKDYDRILQMAYSKPDLIIN